MKKIVALVMCVGLSLFSIGAFAAGSADTTNPPVGSVCLPGSC